MKRGTGAMRAACPTGPGPPRLLPAAEEGGDVEVGVGGDAGGLGLRLRFLAARLDLPGDAVLEAGGEHGDADGTLKARVHDGAEDDVSVVGVRALADQVGG